MRARVRLTRLATGLRPSRKRPRRVLVQKCLKPRKSNVSGLPTPAMAAVRHREPAKLHEAGLLRMEAETKPGQPLSDVAEASLRIPLVLEPDDDIVSITNDHRFAIRDSPTPFLVKPQVEHVMQEHVRQHGGNNCPLRRAHARVSP